MSDNQTQVMEWDGIEKAIAGTRLILLYGPPGTGKTSAAINAAKSLKLRVFNVTLTDETPAAELRGHYLPAGNEWKWQHGPAVVPFIEGGMLVLNEIDKASDDTLDFLHGLLDDSSMANITLPTGETIFPHENFRVVATMNGSPRDLPTAIQDRFAPAVFIRSPHPDAIASLPEDLRTAAENSAGNDQDPDRPATLRRWKAFAAMRDTCGEDIAAQTVFGHRATEILDALRLAGSR